MAKMMNYIDLDTPSDNRCGTFKYFRAALETYLQVGPPLSLDSIKMANIYEIREVLYDAGWRVPKSFILCLTCSI